MASRIAAFRVFKRLRILEQELAILKASQGAETTEAPKDRHVLIVANGMSVAAFWARTNRVSTKEAVYVHSPEVLYGWSPDTPVVFVKGWGDRKDGVELWEIATGRFENVEEDTQL